VITLVIAFAPAASAEPAVSVEGNFKRKSFSRKRLQAIQPRKPWRIKGLVYCTLSIRA
jgi:hypothetical protein